MTSTSKLPINLENLLRLRQVEGERIEYKAGWNPDDFLYANGVLPSSPGLRGPSYPGLLFRELIQPHRGCAPNNARSSPPDGTALRFDISVIDTQGRPHCVRPTLGWRTESRWDTRGWLDLTEGRSTGISKIIGAMAANGSPAPEFETDDDRSYFLIRLPVHEKAAAWTAEVTSTEHAAAHVTAHVTEHVERSGPWQQQPQRPATPRGRDVGSG